MYSIVLGYLVEMQKDLYNKTWLYPQVRKTLKTRKWESTCGYNWLDFKQNKNNKSLAIHIITITTMSHIFWYFEPRRIIMINYSCHNFPGIEIPTFNTLESFFCSITPYFDWKPKMTSRSKSKEYWRSWYRGAAPLSWYFTTQKFVQVNLSYL